MAHPVIIIAIYIIKLNRVFVCSYLVLHYIHKEQF